MGKGRNWGCVLRLCIGVLAVGCFASGAQAISDCNRNGVPDYCDVATSTCGLGAADCAFQYGGTADDYCQLPDGDGDYTPDICDGDCNGNSIEDQCDIADTTCDADFRCNELYDPAEICQSADDNGNAVPDECEGTPSGDCNGNSIPDVCDIDLGTCDVQNYCSDWPREERCLSLDCNGNATPDECDISEGTSDDCQPNGIPDECEEDC
ncbi:MAG: hypothetical protein JSU68_09675, partial [Phycisphaerales bacterium]